MRKIIMWFVGTAAVVVVLFNYRTSTMGKAGVVSVAASTGANAPGIVAGATPLPTAGSSPEEADQRTPPSGADSSDAATRLPRAGTVSTAGSTLVVNGSVVTTLWGPV